MVEEAVQWWQTASARTTEQEHCQVRIKCSRVDTSSVALGARISKAEWHTSKAEDVGSDTRPAVVSTHALSRECLLSNNWYTHRSATSQRQSFRIAAALKIVWAKVFANAFGSFCTSDVREPPVPSEPMRC